MCIRDRRAFDDGYKNWYARMNETQGELMKQEYPNTDKEAFLRRNEGSIFAKALSDIRENGQITTIPFLRGKPVHVAFDLGRNDTTAL